jgi:hypothetical protein
MIQDCTDFEGADITVEGTKMYNWGSFKLVLWSLQSYQSCFVGKKDEEGDLCLAKKSWINTLFNRAELAINQADELVRHYATWDISDDEKLYIDTHLPIVTSQLMCLTQEMQYCYWICYHDGIKPDLFC